jgi:formamidopyrimidine-DNA glycosylase
MPELPEVETVKRGLSVLLPGLTVAKVTHDNPKSFPNAVADISRFLIGAKITDVRRRAKVLMIDLDTNYSLVIHLKMTGQLVFRGKEVFGAGHPSDSLIGKLPDKSTRVIFYLNTETSNALGSRTRKKRSAQEAVHKLRSESTGAFDAVMDQERWQSFELGSKAGQSDACLFFNDQRKFGWVRLIPTIEIPNIDFMKKVGPEPLEKTFTAQEFAERISKRKNSVIKAALLDQTVVAGVGNIYADESLWAAKIHPATKVKDVPLAKLKLLFKELIAVLLLSIEKGGSTDRNYVNAEGKKGSYISFANVFRKEGKPCKRHPNILIEKIRVAGRGTHICPACQKI